MKVEFSLERFWLFAYPDVPALRLNAYGIMCQYWCTWTLVVLCPWLSTNCRRQSPIKDRDQAPHLDPWTHSFAGPRTEPFPWSMDKIYCFRDISERNRHFPSLFTLVPAALAPFACATVWSFFVHNFVRCTYTFSECNPLLLCTLYSLL